MEEIRNIVNGKYVVRYRKDGKYCTKEGDLIEEESKESPKAPVRRTKRKIVGGKTAK